MEAVLPREGTPVAYHIPVLVRRLGDALYLAKNEDLGIYVQGDSEQYVLDRFVDAVKAYMTEFGPELLEPYRDADVRVVDV